MFWIRCGILQRRTITPVHWKRLCSVKSSSSSSFSSSQKSYTWMLLIPITTFGLGTWQVYRLQWKKNLIRELDYRTHAEPLPLNVCELKSPEKQISKEYYRVKVDGHFDHSQEILLGPRVKNVENSENRGGLAGPSSSHIGYHVVTPFVLDNGERILVNRGWVGKSSTDPKSRMKGQTTDRITLTGVVRKNEGRPSFVIPVAQESFTWNYCDIPIFSEKLGTLPILIDADSSSNVPGGPVGGQTRVKLRNEHLQYIITWYGLSAATLYLYFKLRRTNIGAKLAR